MKHLTSLLCALLTSATSISAFAEATVPMEIYQGTNLLKTGEVVYSDAPLTFRTGNGSETMWYVLGLGKNQKSMLIAQSEAPTAEFTFDPAMYADGSNQQWKWSRDAYRIYDADADSELFSIEIRCVSDANDFGVSSLSMALLPGSIKISNVNFDISDFDYELDMVYPYGKFYCDVTSDRASVMGASLWDIDPFDPTQHGTDEIFIAMPSFYPGEQFSYEADWFEYLVFWASNKYGLVYQSSSVPTNNYITHPNVLDRLQQINGTTSIEMTESENNPLYSLENNSIIPNNNVLGVTVHSVSGALLISSNGNATVNLNHLQSGIYIASLRYADGKVDTVKILKK